MTEDLEYYENKNALFHSKFADFQYNSKKNNEYIKYEGFIEIKIIFKLYTEVHDYKGFNYNNINYSSFKSLINELDYFQKKELYSFFIKKLDEANIETDKSKYISELLKLDIICKWKDWLKKPFYLNRLLKVIIKLSMLNIFSLIIVLLLFFSCSAVLFDDAPYECMQLWIIEKQKFSDYTFLNNLINSLTYFVGLENKMKIKSISLWGVFLEIFIKILYILIILNYCIKGVLLKLKSN